MTDATLAPAAQAGAAPQRRIELPGIYNLRDVGGYAATTGSVRWRALLRSDAPAGLSSDSLAQLAQAGLTRVVDLRSDDERARVASDYSGLDIVEIHVPVHSDAAPEVTGSGAAALEGIYELMVDRSGAALVDALRAIASAGPDRAALVHCTAGKDRTGVVVACALLAVGVDRDTVLDDYALSQDYLAGEWADRMRAAIAAQFPAVPEDIDEIIVASPRDLLARTLDRIDAAYGSLRAYLLAHGMTQADLQSLHDHLIIPAEEAS